MLGVVADVQQYELVEDVDFETHHPDARGREHHKFKKGVLAHPTEEQQAVLEEFGVPQGWAKRHRKAD